MSPALLAGFPLRAIFVWRKVRANARRKYSSWVVLGDWRQMATLIALGIDAAFQGISVRWAMSDLKHCRQLPFWRSFFHE
ncbi:hypothetical protein WKK05_06235 [Nostoc sp. UHCC 0302]|uniref:hypothetical protein n=1 Tax=Nostoc sp. UHCC 0302 TaxID=3134896 RepID=UPI00311CA5CB